MTVRKLLRLLIPALGSMSCESPSQDGGKRSAPADGPVPVELTITKERKYGNARGEGDDSTALMYPSTTLIDPSGNLAIFNFKGQDAGVLVTVLDSMGGYVRTVGRKGKGPGEYLVPSRAGLLGDTLWVADEMQARVTLFPVGAPPAVLEFSGPDSLGERVWLPVALLSQGGAVRVIYTDTSRRYLQLDRSGKVLNTIATLTCKPPGRVGTMQFGTWLDYRCAHFTVDHRGSAIYLVDGPAAGSAERGTMVVTRMGSDGKEHWKREIAYVPKLVTQGTKDSLLGDWQGEKRAAMAKSFPEFVPPVSDLFAGKDGTLVIQGQSYAAPSTNWYLVGPRGSLMGYLALPHHSRIVEADSTHVWLAEADSTEVVSIYRYRISRR
jgi:hypothetical protein